MRNLPFMFKKVKIDLHGLKREMVDIELMQGIM